MARKQIRITIEEEGEDQGKVFVITRMDAISAEAWGRRVMQAAIKGSAGVSQDVGVDGLAAVAQLGIRVFGHMDPDQTDLLMGQLQDCIQIEASPNVVRKFNKFDFEELGTLPLLLKEAFLLHTSVFTGAAALFSPLVAAFLVNRSSSPSPSTSPGESTSSSAPA